MIDNFVARWVETWEFLFSVLGIIIPFTITFAVLCAIGVRIGHWLEKK